MERDLETMSRIMEEKNKELAGKSIPPLDQEGNALAEHKRFTFDIVDTPADPLR